MVDRSGWDAAREWGRLEVRNVGDVDIGEVLEEENSQPRPDGRESVLVLGSKMKKLKLTPFKTSMASSMKFFPLIEPVLSIRTTIIG